MSFRSSSSHSASKWRGLNSALVFVFFISTRLHTSTHWCSCPVSDRYRHSLIISCEQTVQHTVQWYNLPAAATFTNQDLGTSRQQGMLRPAWVFLWCVYEVKILCQKDRRGFFSCVLVQSPRVNFRMFRQFLLAFLFLIFGEAWPGSPEWAWAYERPSVPWLENIDGLFISFVMKPSLYRVIKMPQR